MPKKITFLSIPPTDTATKQTIIELVASLDESWEIIYTWSAKWQPGL
jgi:hypothetical protein